MRLKKDFLKKVRTYFLELLEDLTIKEIMTSKGLDQKDEDQFQESC